MRQLPAFPALRPALQFGQAVQALAARLAEQDQRQLGRGQGIGAGVVTFAGLQPEVSQPLVQPLVGRRVRAQQRGQHGDVEEGMRAAQAIGDDTLQREAQGRVVPDSFTHGTSAQRQFWLRRGMESGDPAACDTFSGAI